MSMPAALRLTGAGGGDSTLSESGQKLSATAHWPAGHASGSAAKVRIPLMMSPKAIAKVSNLAIIFLPELKNPCAPTSAWPVPSAKSGGKRSFFEEREKLDERRGCSFSNG